MMKMLPKLKLPKMKCLKCGHVWVPRKQEICICPNPKCHSILRDKKVK